MCLPAGSMLLLRQHALLSGDELKLSPYSCPFVGAPIRAHCTQLCTVALTHTVLSTVGKQHKRNRTCPEGAGRNTQRMAYKPGQES